jgi:hypothetical protein
MWMVSTKLTMVVRYRTRIQWKSIFCSHNIHPSFIHPSWCTGGCWFNLACVGIKLWWLREREREKAHAHELWQSGRGNLLHDAWCKIKFPSFSFLLPSFFLFSFFSFFFLLYMYLSIYLFIYFYISLYIFFFSSVLGWLAPLCLCVNVKKKLVYLGNRNLIRKISQCYYIEVKICDMVFSKDTRIAKWDFEDFRWHVQNKKKGEGKRDKWEELGRSKKR